MMDRGTVLPESRKDTGKTLQQAYLSGRDTCLPEFRWDTDTFHQGTGIAPSESLRP
jgi:hypothetical protein